MVLELDVGGHEIHVEPQFWVACQLGQRLCHGNSIKHALRAKTHHASCRCDGILPLCGRFGPEDPQCGSGDEAALKVEGVVNGTVQAEEALCGSSRLEPLQLALAASDSLMRVLLLRPIVLSQSLLVPAGQWQTPQRRTVGAQLVGDEQR